MAKNVARKKAPGSTASRSGRSRPNKPRLLLTGFGPFPGAPENPTGPLIKTLARRLRGSTLRVSTHVFETTYLAVDRDLPRLIRRIQPDAILMFGLAGKSRALRIEAKARNRIARLPDASFTIPDLQKIEVNGAGSRPIRASVNSLLRAAKSDGLPARLSQNAGDYLCNYLYWRVLAAAEQGKCPKKAVFVHVPLPSDRHPLSRMIDSGEAISLALTQTLRRKSNLSHARS